MDNINAVPAHTPPYLITFQASNLFCAKPASIYRMICESSPSIFATIGSSHMMYSSKVDLPEVTQVAQENIPTACSKNH